MSKGEKQRPGARTWNTRGESIEPGPERDELTVYNLYIPFTVPNAELRITKILMHVSI
jgi:hypothetical protein